MADGALVITEANNNTKKTPIASIPETFLMPFAQTDDKKVTLPTGGTYIW